jgi:solute carrier family 25 (peroxisomal adenine nucleotide transporter), member 17
MLAKTRVQTAHSSPSSTLNKNLTILQIWQTALEREGPRGLYQGLEAQVVKGVVSQGVTLMIKTRYCGLLKRVDYWLTDMLL